MPLPADDGTAICRANRGTPLFLRFGGECSNVEDPPYFGADEAAQQACARAGAEGFLAMRITVDNGPTIDIHTPRFELLSPQGRVRLPANNVLGGLQTATFAAHAGEEWSAGFAPASTRSRSKSCTQSSPSRSRPPSTSFDGVTQGTQDEHPPIPTQPSPSLGRATAMDEKR